MNMDLFLSKLLPVFVYPLGLAIGLILLAGLMVLIGRRHAGALMITVAVAILWTASMPVFSDAFFKTLESRYPPVAVDVSPMADAIVLLGGVVGTPEPPRLSADLGSSVDRVLHTARLYRAGKVRKVIVSGGYIPWMGSSAPEAAFLRDLLVEWGVAVEDVIIESASKTTYENAVFTRKLLKEHSLDRVLLVTSAFHMRRAFATFLSVGAEVVPSPTDIEVVLHEQHSILDWLPDTVALDRTTRAMKEYLGFFVYRWRGWIDGEVVDAVR